MKTKKQWFAVVVDYQTAINGNPASTRLRLRADNESQAYQIASDRVSAYKRCGKVNGGHVEGYAAPIDWAKERDQVEDTREKALNYLLKAVSEAVGCEIDFSKNNPLGYTLLSSNKMPATVESLFLETSVSRDYYVAGLPYTSQIDLCVLVQKAIAEKGQ